MPVPSTHSSTPPRRPRPGPGSRPAAPSAAPAPDAPPVLPSSAPSHRGVVVLADETIRVPGLAAYFRRHPRLVQRGGVAAVAGGILLFVVAGATTPLAGANTSAPHVKAKATGLPPARVDTAPRPAPAIAAAPDVASAAPVRAKTKAPVGHGVISGLAANGIPKVALNAYRVAAARMGNVEPGCGIDWALLAGIGREESDHGRFAGAVLHADGVSTPRIIGPALDGARWDYIPAPANGAELAGDAKYAHALGPMQFIPSTWDLYGTDATGDGKADIFNINDAALGAARYLCAAGGNLRSHEGQVRAVLAYNHNDEYLAQVLALADAYRRGVAVTGIPVGITKGALPKVADTGYIPPANPGAPTAVDRSAGAAAGKQAGKQAGKHKPGPRPGTSRTAPKSSAPRAPGVSSGTSRPAPAPTTGTAPAPQPSGSTTTTKPAPSPSPSPTCNKLQSLLGCRG
jgi:membrane-bound lytic murein transglycosylase B